MGLSEFNNSFYVHFCPNEQLNLTLIFSSVCLLTHNFNVLFMSPDLLLKFGFSEKEAMLYLAMLETGSAVVSEIIKKADLNRSTTYIILESLMQKGLVTMSERNKVSTYTPLPPERLVGYLQEHVQTYTNLVGEAQSLLPELKAIYTKPRIRYYEGVDGIESAYEDTLTSSECIRAYCCIDNMHKALPEYFPQYYKRRAAKGISARAIIPDTPAARERAQHNHEEARETRLVSPEAFAFSPEINIYDKKVVFFSWLERFAFMIESQEIADAMKKAFELAWVGAEHIKNTSLPLTPTLHPYFTNPTLRQPAPDIAE